MPLGSRGGRLVVLLVDAGGVEMGAFEDVHRDRITGSLAMFDRMIFKGYLTRLYPNENMRCFLWTQGVPLKDFTA